MLVQGTPGRDRSDMKKLKINMDQLMWAFEDASGYLEYFLNTETGELFPEDELPGWERKKVKDNPSLVSVPGGDPAEGFRDMEDFISGVEDPACRLALGRVLGGRGGPFPGSETRCRLIPENGSAGSNSRRTAYARASLNGFRFLASNPLRMKRARDHAPKR